MGAPPPDCSERFERRIPPGDDRERLVCRDCGFIAYENPKVIVASVVHAGDRILMCRRAIPPGEGLWTLPAGHLEVGETPEEGALREAWEEAFARIEIEALLAVYSITHQSQVQLVYRARLADPAIAPGAESHEVELFTWNEIPWQRIAFPSVHWALADFRDTRGLVEFAPRRNPAGRTGRDARA